MLKSLIEKHYPHMVDLREDFHRHPELAFDLPFTSALVQEELKALGLEVHAGIASSGLVGILRGGKPGKTVMLRADMDALPVQELADVPYASVEAGHMHACAHDGHMAALLGAAAALTEMQNDIPGNIVFLFQPAEETKYGGATVMIDEGVLNILPMDAIFSGHLWGSVPLGHIHVKSGVTMASRDEFHIRITGKGGHGAMPHLTVDPIVIAAQVITALQTLVSRSVDPSEPAVVSICQIYTTDGAPNVIADFVDMTGTVRAYDEGVRSMLLEKMEKMLVGTCESHGGSCVLTYTGGCPAVYNDAAMTALALKSAAKVVGEGRAVALTKPMAGSEDFSLFSQALTSCYVFAGISEGAPAVHHSPHFAWKSEAMKPFAEYLATVALDFLQENQGYPGCRG